jgi:hypothetical protein
VDLDPRCPVHPHVRLTWVALMGLRCAQCSTERVERAFALLHAEEATAESGAR